MNTYYLALALTFLHPYGDDNRIVPNSFTIGSVGQYHTEDACNKAQINTPEIFLNQGKSDLRFSQTTACIPAVTADQAGAFLTVGAATQYDGFRLQVSDNAEPIPVANLDICLSALETFSQLEPNYTLDDSLILYGRCDESGR